MSEEKRDFLKSEIDSIDLTKNLDEVIKTLAQSKMGVREQDTFIEISIELHQRYENFAIPLVKQLIN
jgi:hypothetical protein